MIIYKEIMKKSCFLLLLIFVSMAVSFSKPVNSKKLTGYVCIYGNEPFTFAGFKTENGGLYTLVADEQTLKTLRLQQGKLLEITGIVTDSDEIMTFNMLDNGYFEVLEWKEKNNEG